MGVLASIILWLVVLVVAVVAIKVLYSLATKPNLRYYLWKTAKDVKFMYYRYHV